MTTNGYGAAIFVYPPQGGEPSKVGDALEWRIDGTVVFGMRPPVVAAGCVWAQHQAVLRSASVILSGWTFDEYFLSCLSNSFLLTLDAGPGYAHRATGRLTNESIKIMRQCSSQPLRFESCTIQPAIS